VVVGNGTNDVIYALARALRPRRAAIVEPTYTEYFRASQRIGASVDHWLADSLDFAPQPFDPQGADLVWLANPNNPTGRLWAPGRLGSWMEAHPQTVFVVDEAFLPFRQDEAKHSLIPALDRLANVVVLRSLTKLYTLPGLRLGYAVAGSRLAAELRAEIVPWSVNAPAQVAGVAALQDNAFLVQTHAWFSEEMPAFFERLRGISAALEPVPSESNSVLVRLRGMTAGTLVSRLAARSFAIRDASNFIGLGENYVRLAVRKPDDNRRLMAALQAVCCENHNPRGKH
jgi:threonine-phosphate decarboxylase